MFDVLSNPNTEMVLEILKPKDIVLYGVSLDIRDAHIIKGLFREATLYICFQILFN